jgi:hypothetical protein
MHAGFSGFRRFVTRKKCRCKLIGKLFVIPHNTILSNVISLRMGIFMCIRFCPYRMPLCTEKENPFCYGNTQIEIRIP